MAGSRSKKTKVSIIVANNRADKLLVETVESVVKVMEKDWELVVVNNNLKKGEKEKLERLEKRLDKKRQIRLMFLDQCQGAAEARNAGVKQSRGKYLMFLDNDTEVKQGWLKKTLKFMEGNQDVGAGQLKLLRMDRKTVFDSAGDLVTGNGFLVERAREAEDKGQFDKVEEIFSGKGAGMMVRRRVFEKIGGFEADYGYYWEEPDLFWRVWKTGKIVVFLWMDTVWHAYGSQDKQVSREREVRVTYLGCRNQLLTILKNGVGWQGVRMAVMVSLSWLGLLGLFLVRGDWGRARAVGRAFGWLVGHGGWLKRRRKQLKQRLGKGFYSDQQWRSRVEIKRGWDWYWGKGINYVLGRPF